MKVGKVSVLVRLNCLDKFGLHAQFQTYPGGTWNTEFLDNFVTFLMVGRTQDFDFG
jgi:hypothetical protein